MGYIICGGLAYDKHAANYISRVHITNSVIRYSLHVVVAPTKCYTLSSYWTKIK